MQIRCTHCTKTLALAASGDLPAACPHCAQRPGPGPLGPYDAVRLLAAGGMGEVYLARHRELGTEVAVKVLPAMPLDAIPALRERFAREARLTARVQHAGVVKVLGEEVAGDRPYLVLEYVAGQTLRERLRQGPLPVVEAARCAAATADVLAAAHHERVLHRDIKPDNVMLTPEGDVRVLDFGIARCLQDDAPLTRTGEIVGTPEYMAPEQLLDGPEAITERTDVHALGVLLHELLTGRSPFHGANVFQALKLVESLLPPPPSSLRAEVPKELDAVVAHALAKSPDERLPSAAAFAAAVRQAVPAAVEDQPTPTPTSRRFLWPLVAGALLAGAAIAWSLQRPAPPPGENPAASAIASTAAAATSRAAAEQQLREGQWNQALAAADGTSTPGTWTSPDLAREAFVLAHAAWPLAVGAPWWLCASDEARRARLFGDRLEPGADVTPLRTAWSGSLHGVAVALDTSASTSPGDAAAGALDRAALLRAHLAAAASDADTTDPELRRHHDAHARPDDALTQLLGIRLLPPDQRPAAFEAYAQRLPIEASEHWLARMGAHHLRGQAAEGTRAAEMAWLSGAGELAVLLDAWLQIAPSPAHQGWRRLDGPQLERLRRRVAGADAADTPARMLLLACLDAVHELTLDTAPLAAVPPPLAASASRWFVHAATHPLSAGLLRVAVALGATPDYSIAPWRELDASRRAPIDAEVRRGR